MNKAAAFFFIDSFAIIFSDFDQHFNVAEIKKSITIKFEKKMLRFSFIEHLNFIRVQ